MRRPRSWNSTSFCSSLCVPTTRSTRARAQIVTGPCVCCCGVRKARERADVYGEAAEAVEGRRVMLLRQHGRRHEDGDLLSVEHGLHGRAQRDLGLAEADVAAQQTVHGLRRLHVRLDLLDAAQLIVRLGVGEVVLELRLPRRVGREGVAHAALALGIELDEPGGKVLGRGFRAGLCLLPLVTAELVEPDDRVLAAANVFGDEIKLRRRDIQRVRALIGDLDIVLDDAVDAASAPCRHSGRCRGTHAR